MNYSGIYCLEHEGNILYVGSSKNLLRRKKQTFNRLIAKKYHNKYMQSFFLKNKDINFNVVFKCDSDELIDFEQKYIDKLNPMFNIADAYGKKAHTEESKEKMRGRVFSEEHRRKISEANTGKPSKRKGIKTNFIPTSSFKKGDTPWNKDTKGIMKAWNKGLTLSDSHKKKLSEAKRKNNLSGLIFNHWKVIKFSKIKNKAMYYKCECKCGLVKDVCSTHLRRSTSKQCRSCASKEAHRVKQNKN